MVDDLEEKNPVSLDLQHYLGILRRRHIHFLIPLLLGWAVVWSASWTTVATRTIKITVLGRQPSPWVYHDAFVTSG